MNYQQSYPGMWLGPAAPLKPYSPPDPDELLADLEDEREYEMERAMDEARERLDGRYDD